MRQKTLSKLELIILVVSHNDVKYPIYSTPMNIKKLTLHHLLLIMMDTFLGLQLV